VTTPLRAQIMTSFSLLPIIFPLLRREA